MFVRIGLAALAIAAATQTVKAGAFIAAPFAPSGWQEIGTFPWFVPTDLAPEGLVLLAAAFIVVCLTAWEIVRQIGIIAAAHTVYVSRSRIFWLGVLLACAAFIYGAFVGQFEGGPARLHLSSSRYPVNLAAWFILAPIALVVLNFVREIAHAVREYEIRARGRVPLDEAVRMHLAAILGEVAKLSEIDERQERMEERQRAILGLVRDISRETPASAAIAAMRGDLRLLSSATAGTLDQHRSVLGQSFDGLFRFLREMRAEARAARPAVPVLAPPAPSAAAD